MICPEELVALISSIAVALARGLDDTQLELFAVSFSQLGDTLATIAVQRGNVKEALEKCKQYYENNNEENNYDNNANNDNEYYFIQKK